MAVAIAAAVLAASTQIQSTVTIQTFQMQADTLSGNSCTITPLTSIDYGILPTNQPLANTNFCLMNSAASPIFTGGASITAPVFAVTGSLPPGITEDWIVGASNSPGCVAVSVPTSLTINAAAGANVWTVSSSNVGSCNVGSTISYFVLAHTGTSVVPGVYGWTTKLNAYTTTTG